MRVFTIDVAKGCVSFELWLPEQMGRFDKWYIAAFSPATARRSPHSPHAAAFFPLCSPLLHRYLLYPQPNVIGLRSILRNCFPPLSQSLFFRHVHVPTVFPAHCHPRARLCVTRTAQQTGSAMAAEEEFWTVEKWWYTVHKQNMGIFLNLTFHKSLQ